MDICENCHGRLDDGVEMEDGELLCGICYRQREEEAHCDFELNKRYEKEIREGSI
jgi:hypothetical protein